MLDALAADSQELSNLPTESFVGGSFYQDRTEMSAHHTHHFQGRHRPIPASVDRRKMPEPEE